MPIWHIGSVELPVLLLTDSTMVSKKYFSLNLVFFLIASVITSDLRRVLPLNLKIREGEDLQLRLTTTLPEAISCYVKTPSLISYNLKSEESDNDNRISYWTENGQCGVIARNVKKEDAGMWRLTEKNSTHTLVDSTLVEILDKVEVLDSSFEIESGLPYTLTLDENSKYCWVRQPHTNGTFLVAGECKVEIDAPSSAVQGNWSATAGVIGQLQEVPVTARLDVLRDKLATGYTRNINTNTISAYCNLRNSDSELEFCRFSKPDSMETGFQLSAGLRSGRYGYYGAGLENGECGITIEAPTEKDYGQWLCSVGVKDKEPFGSYVWINSDVRQTAVTRAQVLPTNSITTVLNGVLQLRCEASVPIAYCWFSGPNNKIFTPKQSAAEENASYRYIGTGFGVGQCGMEITNAEAEHEGDWTCHMGPKPSGFELTSKLTVRISETPLAAKEELISVRDGEILTLDCRTVPNKITIDYCRFLMPDGTGIHIDGEITENNPLILDGTRYWFSGVGLRVGDCGLKVDAVSQKHFGQWTCAARLEPIEGNTEVFDIIVVERVEENSSTTQDNLTAAATTGIISGVFILVGIAAAGSMWVLKRIRARGFQDNISGAETISVSRSSMSSASSTSSISLQEMTCGSARR